MSSTESCGRTRSPQELEYEVALDNSDGSVGLCWDLDLLSGHPSVLLLLVDLEQRQSAISIAIAELGRRAQRRSGHQSM